MTRKQPAVEVEREYGANLLYIALPPPAALVKADQSFRVLRNATHGPRANPRVVERGAVPTPSTPELKV
eukprot:4589087-Alexandrium_andersonii.AAC.1